MAASMFVIRAMDSCINSLFCYVALLHLNAHNEELTAGIMFIQIMFEFGVQNSIDFSTHLNIAASPLPAIMEHTGSELTAVASFIYYYNFLYFFFNFT